MVDKWVAIEVIDGPQSLQGKVAKVRLDPDRHSRADNEYSDFRNLGRIEFMRMFGDFEGLEKISRIHIIVSDHLNQGELNIEDRGSTNGTDFPNGNQGKEIIAVLGGVLKVKITWSLESIAISQEDFIIAAPRTSETGYSPQRSLDFASKISIDEMTDWVARFVAYKNAQFSMAEVGFDNPFDDESGLKDTKKDTKDEPGEWRYQIRRSWKVRDVPVSESTKFDYEWKIFPNNMDAPSDVDEVLTPLPDGDGVFYIFRLSEDGFILEHSNAVMSGNPYWLANTTTIIPFGGKWNWGRDEGPEEDPHHLVEYLNYLCSKFGPNHYSRT